MSFRNNPAVFSYWQRHLSLWLESEGLDAEALDEGRFDTFLHTRGKPNGGAVLGRELFAHLRRIGRIPDAPEPAASNDPMARIERTYERYLINERGLSPSTVGKYLAAVHAFLAKRFGARDVALETLVARDANRFIVRHAVSRSHAQGLATALRSFLRHLHQRGDIAADLAGAIPTVTNWRLSELPNRFPRRRGVGSGKLRTAIRLSAAGTMPSCCCWRGWACAAAKWPR